MRVINERKPHLTLIEHVYQVTEDLRAVVNNN